MSAYSLRCRVCEEVTVAEPLDACRRCDGPTDIALRLGRIERVVTRAAVAAGPASLWRYHDLLPAGAAGRLRRRLDTARPLRPRSPTRSASIFI